MNFSVPWEHTVIDDFLPIELLHQTEKIFDNNIVAETDLKRKRDWPQIKINFFPKKENLTIVEFDGEVNEYKPVEREIEDITLDYIMRLYRLLYPLAKETNPLISVHDSLIIAYSDMCLHHEYRSHTDHEDKLFSGIVYLSSGEFEGTLLQSVFNGPVVKEVEWAPNRLLAFRRTDETWHKYRNFTGESRKTLMFQFVKNTR